MYGYFFAFQKNGFFWKYATLSNGNRISGKCHHTVSYVMYQAEHNTPIIVCMSPHISQTGVPWVVPNKHCVFPTFLYTKYVTVFSKRTHMPICDGMLTIQVVPNSYIPPAVCRAATVEICRWMPISSRILSLPLSGDPFSRWVIQKTNFFCLKITTQR